MRLLSALRRGAAGALAVVGAGSFLLLPHVVSRAARKPPVADASQGPAPSSQPPPPTSSPKKPQRTTKNEEGNAAAAVAAAAVDFIAAQEGYYGYYFAGAKPGYYFRKGAKGVGYYIDTKAPPQKKKKKKKAGTFKNPDTTLPAAPAAPANPAALAASARAAAAAAAAATAKLAEEKAAAEAAAAVKAQEEAGFSELALWRLEVGEVVGKLGTAVKQTAQAKARRVMSPALQAAYERLLSIQHFVFPSKAAVHRVVNPALQAAYERKKKALVARLGAANVNEQFLIHGTSLANSEAIISNNFCLSKVGAYGQFGRGFYFSANFNTGAVFAGASGALLLCKVLVAGWLQEIVVFEPEQVLPMYRIAL